VTVDHGGPEPVYLQIAAILRGRIERGEIQPAHPVPSEPRLVQEFGVNRLTARKAVRVLASEGLVEIVRGRGAYVRRDYEAGALKTEPSADGAS
jgi:GntR family transcriptional regulator